MFHKVHVDVLRPFLRTANSPNPQFCTQFWPILHYNLPGCKTREPKKWSFLQSLVLSLSSQYGYIYMYAGMSVQ